MSIRDLHAWVVFSAIAASTASCGGDGFSGQSNSPGAGGQQDGGSDAAQDAADEPEAAAPDAEPVTCAIQSTYAPCDECINSKCLDSCQKCADDAACQDIVNCVIAGCVTEAGTPDQTCAQNCVKAHPAGLATFGAFWMGLSPGCVALNCAAQCPW